MIKAMVCLGLEPRAVEWWVQTNPLSYGGSPVNPFAIVKKPLE